MALACLGLDMYRHARMVPLMMLAVLMLHPPPASSPRIERMQVRPMAPPVSQPESAGPSVRIEHELVRLPKPRPPRITRPTQWRATRLAAAEPADSHAPLLVRARRALVGDGRYKPEPFPRLAR
jgi:hypothetical protein